MRPKLLLGGVLFLVAVLSALTLWHFVAEETQPSVPPTDSGAPPGQAEVHLAPAVSILVKESAKDDFDQNSLFFKTLAALAKKYGLSREDYIPRRGLLGVVEGYAVKVGTGRDVHVVVILSETDRVLPGTDTQHLVLLNAAGQKLDHISCSICNRLTWYEDSGRFFTEVPDHPQPDKAQLVVRYVPEQGGHVSGNWDHGITFQDQTYTFRWEQDRPGCLTSAEWEEKGLCRVVVCEGKFAVVFPKLQIAGPSSR